MGSNQLAEFSATIRGNALRMVHAANASHFASALSICDVMAML